MEEFKACSECKRFCLVTEFNEDKGMCNTCVGNKFCAACGKEFAPKNGVQKYCSYKCLIASYKKGRFMILQRDEFRCVYCGRSSIEDSVKLAVDHIVPRSAGGPDTACNLVTSCEQCNSEKIDTILGEHLINRLYALVKLRNQLYQINDEQTVKF